MQSCGKGRSFLSASLSLSLPLLAALGIAVRLSGNGSFSCRVTDLVGPPMQVCPWEHVSQLSSSLVGLRTMQPVELGNELTLP